MLKTKLVEELHRIAGDGKGGFIITHCSEMQMECLLVFIESLLEEQKKAYGGCDKCYGKGYATNIDFASGKGIHYQTPYYLPCDCNRGEQIRDMLEQQKKELIEEYKDKIQKYKSYYNPVGDELNKGKHIACDDLLESLKHHD